MSDFTKNKIAFVVALLATLFTITPALEAIGTWEYKIFGIALSVNALYYFTTACFAFAVYVYGVQFLTERNLRYAQFIGDLFYAVAMVAPPLFIVVYFVQTITDVLVKNPYTTALIGNIVSGILVALSSNFVFDFIKSLQKREAASKSELSQREEAQILNRARKLFDDKFYDLCVTECFKAIEIAIRNRLAQLGVVNTRRPLDLLREALQREILPQAIYANADYIRKQRNEIAHSNTQITQDTAEEVLVMTDQILAAINSPAPDNRTQ